MNLLLIAPTVFPCSPAVRYSGIERLVRHWSAELARRGHKVTVVAAEGSEFPRGVNWVRVPQGTFIQGEMVAYGIYRPELQAHDLVLDFSHSHFAMREFRLPAVAWCWHSPVLMQPPLSDYNMLALSRHQAIQLLTYQRVTARVMDPHCGVPVEPGKPSGSYLFIGRVHPTKGSGEAAVLCRELGVPLDIIGGLGPGDPPEYLAQLKALCHDGVAYWGQVDDEVRDSFLASAKALLYPLDAGYEEAHSHKCVDALLAGCKVVTYRRGALSEVIEHGVDGFLAQDREEFKAYMGMVDGLDRGEIRRRAAERWSVDRTVDRAWPLLENVARGLRWGS